MNTETQEQPIEEIDYSDLIATSLEQSDSVALNALLGSVTISEAAVQPRPLIIHRIDET